jgi:tetratricopeptide (TPR) repeat protein
VTSKGTSATAVAIYHRLAKRAARSVATASPKARFEALVAKLEACPDVAVLDAYLGSPATASQLAAAEARIGRPLPSDLRALYASVNGVSIVWADRKHPQWTPRQQRDDKLLVKRHPFDRAAGHVAIQSIDRLFAARPVPLPAGWDHIDTTRPNRNACMKASSVLDIIDECRVASLVVDAERSRVMVTEDKQFGDAVSTDLSTYLDVVFGLCGARERFKLFLGAPTCPPLVDVKLEALSMASILTLVRQDVHYNVPQAEQLAYRFTEVGLAAVDAGRDKQAAELFEELSEIDPSFMRARWHRVLCLARSKQRARAERELPAIVLGGLDLTELHDGAVDLCDAKLRDGARAAILTAIGCWPDDADCWTMLANVLVDDKALADAATCYEHALEIDDSDPDRWTNYADALTSLGRAADARAAKQRAKALR